MYYLCEKYYKPITLQYYTADCVSWVPRLTVGLMNKLNFRMCSRNGTRSYVGDLLYVLLALALLWQFPESLRRQEWWAGIYILAARLLLHEGLSCRSYRLSVHWQGILPVIPLLCGQSPELRTSLWNSGLHSRSVQLCVPLVRPRVNLGKALEPWTRIESCLLFLKRQSWWGEYELVPRVRDFILLKVLTLLIKNTLHWGGMVVEFYILLVGVHITFLEGILTTGIKRSNVHILWPGSST